MVVDQRLPDRIRFLACSVHYGCDCSLGEEVAVFVSSPLFNKKNVTLRLELQSFESMDDITTYSGYNSLVESIGTLLDAARAQIATSVNTVLVQTYWNIGKYIVEFEQAGAQRAEYGSNLLNRLSKDLTLRYGKGFGHSNLIYIRKLYLAFPNSGTLSHFLSWSHYYEILKSEDPLAGIDRGADDDFMFDDEFKDEYDMGDIDMEGFQDLSFDDGTMF